MQSHDNLTATELNILEKEIQNAVRLKKLDEQTSARFKKNPLDDFNSNGNTDAHNNNQNGSGSAKTEKVWLLS
jgi:hypothetical protein